MVIPRAGLSFRPISIVIEFCSVAMNVQSTAAYTRWVTGRVRTVVKLSLLFTGNTDVGVLVGWSRMHLFPNQKASSCDTSSSIVGPPTRGRFRTTAPSWGLQSYCTRSNKALRVNLTSDNILEQRRALLAYYLYCTHARSFCRDEFREEKQSISLRRCLEQLSPPG